MLEALIIKAKALLLAALVTIGLQPIPSPVINPRLSGTIPQEITFTPELHKLAEDIRNLQPGQHIDLHINSLGGIVAAGEDVVHAMENTKGIVDCHIHGIAASMAATISTYCDTLTTTPNSIVLVHTVRMEGMFGVIIYADPKSPEANQFRELFRPFLTPDELAAAFDGPHADIMIPGPEFVKRFNKVKGIE